MAVSLFVAPEAELDLEEAYAWYEKNRPGLGEDFLSSVDACLETIRRQPKMYAPLHEAYRRALIRRFPHFARSGKMAPAPSLSQLQGPVVPCP
jgi:hypothetical protein